MGKMFVPRWEDPATTEPYYWHHGLKGQAKCKSGYTTNGMPPDEVPDEDTNSNRILTLTCHTGTNVAGPWLSDSELEDVRTKPSGEQDCKAVTCPGKSFDDRNFNDVQPTQYPSM